MGNINIIPISVPLPEGWEGTPDEFRQQIFSTLTFQASGDFMTGQIGGAMPTSNVGLYIDGPYLYTWDADTSTYQPINTHPIGSILPYLGSVVPANYLLLDGGQHLVADYKELYALIGKTYIKSTESGDDTHFRVPNMAGRTFFGAGQGDYNPLATAGVPGGLMREMLLHQFDGLEWPRRLNSKHVGQPAANTNPGDVMVYTGVTGTNYTRAMPPHLVINWIVRSK